MQKRKEEQAVIDSIEQQKQDKIRAEMSEIRKRYTQFKHCKVSEEAMRVFASYMKDKMTNKQYKKQKQRDLGLAAIDTHVIFKQMERNDSVDHQLISTNDNRASLKDLNATRPSNYLNSYLERVTDDVKVPKAHVSMIQQETGESLLNTSQNYTDNMSSFHKGSVIFQSKKGSLDVKKSGRTKQPSRQGLFPKLLPLERNNTSKNTYNSPENVRIHSHQYATAGRR